MRADHLRYVEQLCDRARGLAPLIQREAMESAVCQVSDGRCGRCLSCSIHASLTALDLPWPDMSDDDAPTA